jgi:ABC-type phosphate/phosphonate transport system permease subunit
MWHPTPLCKMHHQNNRPSRKAPKWRTMNLKDLVQSLLFYVGIPAVTLYPLGFAALAIQLWNDPLFPYYDFDTVWYAVTLVPKTQVVGTALKLIFISLVATAVGVGIALRVARSVRRRLSLEEVPEGGGRGRWAIYLLVRHRTFLAASREGS